MTTPSILVIGAEGQLGRCLARMASHHPAHFILAPRNELDITDADLIRKYLANTHFDFCINAAAYTKVDLAEEEKELAHLSNAVAPGHLAQECQRQNCTLIHISSDYVYDNGLERPLKEDDPVSPASVYARTKLEGEERALKENEYTIVIRTSWLFSEYGHNFVKTMARLMYEGRALRIVNDQTGCPTYAGDLASAIVKVIEHINTHPEQDDLYGVFNYCNMGVTTWYDFAMEITSMLGISANLTPISSEEYGAAANRPRYSVLDTQKIRQTYGIEIPHWRTGLRHVLGLLYHI